MFWSRRAVRWVPAMTKPSFYRAVLVTLEAAGGQRYVSGGTAIWTGQKWKWCVDLGHGGIVSGIGTPATVVAWAELPGPWRKGAKR